MPRSPRTPHGCKLQPVVQPSTFTLLTGSAKEDDSQGETRERNVGDKSQERGMPLSALYGKKSDTFATGFAVASGESSLCVCVCVCVCVC